MNRWHRQSLLLPLWFLMGFGVLIAERYTEPYTQFPILFLVPILLATWHSGLFWGLLLAAMLPLLRFTAFHFELFPDRTIPSLFTHLVRMLVFIMAAVGLQKLKQANHVLALANDQLHQRTRQLEQAAQEREILIKEIHHRVKNNFNLVISLLNLQKNEMRDSKAIEGLTEAQARIRSMAVTHQLLYQSPNVTAIDMVSFIRQIVDNLRQVYRETTSHIRVTLNVEAIALALDHAIPCGLILTELVTNALKYAYAPGQEGTLLIEFRKDVQGQLRLMVADHGKGLARASSIEPPKTLGLQLVTLLSEQLHGQLTIDGEAGTQVTVSFPLSLATTPQNSA